MAPPPRLPVHQAAQPSLHRAYDPWVASSTGHQRADAKGLRGTGWRDALNSKLQSQYRQATTMTATIGKDASVEETRKKGKMTAMEMLARQGTTRKGTDKTRARDPLAASPQKDVTKLVPLPVLAEPGTGPSAQRRWFKDEEGFVERQVAGMESSQQQREPPPPSSTTVATNDIDTCSPKPLSHPAIFKSVVVYVNGSTWPAISDHRLRHILAAHGALLSSHLARRRVTHVVLGRFCGGGLAAGKLEREIRLKAGSAVKFVGVDWILESVKAGRRLPESRFAPVKTAAATQRGILGVITKMRESSTPESKKTNL